MKDRLKQSKWINRFPNNPTQTQYLRFLESPGKVLKSAFTRNEDKFNNISKNILKTRFTEIFMGENKS